MKLSKILPLAAACTFLFITSPTFAISSNETASLATIAAIDKLEIMLGVVATNKNPSSGVADFAQMMITQHGSNLTQILTMVNQMHALPLKSATAEKMHTEAAQAMIKLGGLQGKEFDKAYVDMMVKGHEGALKLIDTQLLKTAKTEEVKKFITDTRAVVVQHLDHAKDLQAKLQS